MIKPFEYLDNGSLVLASQPVKASDTHICLCIYNSEYVVWTVDAERNAHWGHYFQSSIIEAVKFYQEKTKSQ